MSCRFPSGEFVGKVILYQSRDGSYTLAARSAKDYGWWVDEQRGQSSVQILAAIRVLYQFPDFDSSFGFHREISHSGKVLGGAIALVLGDAIYINGISQAYGALPRQETERILASYATDREASAPQRWLLGEDLRVDS